MAKELKMLDSRYAEALTKYITTPVLKTPGSSTQQKSGNVGAIIENLRKRK